MKRAHSPAKPDQPAKFPKMEIPLHKLPPNVFNTIAGLLDSSSLLELANSHPGVKELVRRSEKHWHEVDTNQYCYRPPYVTHFIDYNFHTPSEAKLLLTNCKIDHLDRVCEVPNARGLIDLPNELMEKIVRPLDNATLMELVPVHQRFNALRRSIDIDYLHHKAGQFAVSRNQYEPIWESLEGADYTRRIPIKNASALDGRRVMFVVYEAGDQLKKHPPKKVKPGFTCENFFFYLIGGCPDRDVYGNSVYLDKAIVQDILKPTNVFSAVFMHFLTGQNFPKGSLSIGDVRLDELNEMKQVYAPALAFGMKTCLKECITLILYYIDEWMAGKRNINTLWVRWGATAVRQALITGLKLAVDPNGIFRGQLKRDDGNLLDVRVRREEIVFQASGTSVEFRNADFRRKPAPVF